MLKKKTVIIKVKPIYFVRSVLDRIGRREPLTPSSAKLIVSRVCDRHGFLFRAIWPHINPWEHVRWRAKFADGPFCPVGFEVEGSGAFSLRWYSQICMSCLSPTPRSIELPGGYYEQFDLGRAFRIDLKKRLIDQCERCMAVYELIRAPQALTHAEVVEKETLGNRHYVYVLVDGGTGAPFYVGKGVGGRAFSHLKEYFKSDHAVIRSEKTRRIHEIVTRRDRVIVSIVRFFEREEEALAHEEFLIKTTPGLTNVVHNRSASDEERRLLYLSRFGSDD
jgi:hypothetical protein